MIVALLTIVIMQFVILSAINRDKAGLQVLKERARKVMKKTELMVAIATIIIACETRARGQDPYEERVLDFGPEVVYACDDFGAEVYNWVTDNEDGSHDGTELSDTVIPDSEGTSIFLYGDQRITGPLSCLNLPGTDTICGTSDDLPISFTVLMLVQADDSFALGGFFRKGTGAAADLYISSGTWKAEMVLYNPQLQESTIVTLSLPSFNPERRHLYAFTYNAGTQTATVDVDGSFATNTLQVNWYQTNDYWQFGDIGTADAIPGRYDGIVTIIGTALTWSQIAELRVRALDGERFIRGDANSDGAVNISDYNAIYNQQGPCLEAMDINGSGGIDIADISYLMSYLYASGPAPSSPFPSCGYADGMADNLTCLEHYCD